MEEQRILDILGEPHKNQILAEALGWRWVRQTKSCMDPEATNPHQCMWSPDMITHHNVDCFSKPAKHLPQLQCFVPDYFENWYLRGKLIAWVVRHSPAFQQKFLGHINDVVDLREVIVKRKHSIAIEAKIKWMLATPRHVAEATYRTIMEVSRGKANKD